MSRDSPCGHFVDGEASRPKSIQREVACPGRSLKVVAGIGEAIRLDSQCENVYHAPKLALVFHLALLALALAALPIGLPAISAAAAPDRAYLWLITILCLGVGLPFFVLSANAPLLQAWFGRSGHIESSDAYFLY